MTLALSALVHLTYIGHATLLIEMDGVRLLTDPILRTRIMHLRRKPLKKQFRSLQVDAVLISHLHFDHLDLPSLKKLGYKTRLIVPQGAKPLLQKAGFQQIEELAMNETLKIDSLSIRATYAQHSNTRHPFGPTAECLGYIIEGQYTFYFAGDTDLFPEMADLHHNLDIALLPVWGWGPTLGEGHLDPNRAAQSLQLLQPQLAIPIHWGTLYPWGFNWLNLDYLVQPPYEFVQQAALLAPQVTTKILELGQSLELTQLLEE